MSTDTIVACCTAQEGVGGAIALIRVSGSEAVAIVDRCARLSHKTLAEHPSHTIHHGFVVTPLQQTVIDEVLFYIMLAPRTFTGEHTVEITCHNNALIIMNIIELLVSQGARLAERGEFTRQAVCNKKIDLVQAEAICDLIHATNAHAIKASLAQLSGSMSHELVAIEQKLIAAVAWCEASFEFVDEVQVFGDQIQDKLLSIVEHIASIRKIYDATYRYRDGFRVALLGAVNAGKSSLFNALIGKNRAIVAPIAGTTRDTIEARVVRDGLAWTLIDTAGLRETDDSVEHEGIERSWHEAQSADLLLLIIDRASVGQGDTLHNYQQLLADRKEAVIVVYTKADLIADMPEQFEHIDIVPVSSVTKQGLSALEALIAQRLQYLCEVQKSPYLVNQRQYALLSQLEDQLKQILHLFEKPITAYELVSYHLQQAIEKLGEISGKTVSDAALDKVFNEFCIGK